MNRKDYLLTVLTAFGSLLGSFFMNLYTEEQFLIGIGGFAGVIIGIFLTRAILNYSNNKSKVKSTNIKWSGWIYILSNLILISTITSLTFWPIFASPQLKDSRNVFLYSLIILSISLTSLAISHERLKALNIKCFNESTEKLKELWSAFFKTLGIGLVVFLILLLLLPITVNMIIFIVFIPLLLFDFNFKKTDNLNRNN